MSDYANYISAKHKTDSAISYSHYTRFYALIRRVCTPAKTWGFSSSIRNNQSRLTLRQATKSELRFGPAGLAKGPKNEIGILLSLLKRDTLAEYSTGWGDRCLS